MRIYAKVLITLMALLATAAPGGAQTLTAQMARDSLDTLPLHAIEGLWRLTDSGIEAAIWRAADGLSYEMTLVTSPSPAVRPGTRLATITPTAQPRQFDAHFDIPDAPDRRFTLRLEDDAHLSFTRVNSGIRVSPIILFPPRMRRGITVGSDRQRDLDGAIKIYPQVPVKGEPRYF